MHYFLTLRAPPFKLLALFSLNKVSILAIILKILLTDFKYLIKFNICCYKQKSLCLYSGYPALGSNSFLENNLNMESTEVKLKLLCHYIIKWGPYSRLNN